MTNVSVKVSDSSFKLCTGAVGEQRRHWQESMRGSTWQQPAVLKTSVGQYSESQARIQGLRLSPSRG